MGMSTQPSKEHTGRMTSPDLRLRTSTCLWGPLQLTLTNHREGAELGYQAGQVAYQEDGDSCLEDAMAFYLAAPRYRPRTCTPRIIREWQALFLLGWTSGLLEGTEPVQETDDQMRRRYEASQPTLNERDFVTRGKEVQQ